MVSFTFGNGNRGKDPWKLYNPGLFQLDKILTITTHNLVFRLTFLPRASNIHPLYINNNFSVYRIV